MVNDNISVIGSWIKFALSLDLPGSLSMDDVGFEAVFYIYGNKTVVIPKSGMIRISLSLTPPVWGRMAG